MQDRTKFVLAAALVMGLCGTSFGHAPPGELYFAVQFPDNLVPPWTAICLTGMSSQSIHTRSATTASIRRSPISSPWAAAKSMSAT